MKQQRMNGSILEFLVRLLDLWKERDLINDEALGYLFRIIRLAFRGIDISQFEWASNSLSPGERGGVWHKQRQTKSLNNAMACSPTAVHPTDLCLLSLCPIWCDKTIQRRLAVFASRLVGFLMSKLKAHANTVSSS